MGKLFIVATPIGNLADITLRAIETLKSVDLILCEDTRVSQKLLQHYQIIKPLVSYHHHSDTKKITEIIQQLRLGKSIALISDAGTPGISDPGNKLIDEVVNDLGDEVEIISIPGPSALIAALAISGLPTDRFSFFGFLPHKKGRLTMLQEIATSSETTVFYESTHRIMKALEQLMPLVGNNRKIVIGRELTKKFETIYRGNIKKVIEKLKSGEQKGEFVVIVEAARD